MDRSRQQHGPQYPQEFIDRLQLVWGAGFLSPGGPEEVARIVEGLALRDKAVLDLGCGVGGPAIVLARRFGARVTCLDVEETLIENARRNAAAAGVSGQIDFVLARPGPLPFAPARFDVVFSKEAMLHIPDKAALFADLLRVLVPGGWLAASDWLKGEEAENDPGYQRYIAQGHLSYRMATAAQSEAQLRAAGFADVRSLDRHEWYAPRALQELRDIEGPLREELIAVSGRETYEKWLSARRGSAAAFNSGGLRPVHLRARKPG